MNLGSHPDVSKQRNEAGSRGRAFRALLKKEFLLEWRTRVKLNGTLFFSILVLLLFSFAVGPESKLLQRLASGFFWLVILLASTLSLGESFRQERDNEAFVTSVLGGVPAWQFFIAKALSNALYLLFLALVLTPLLVVLYGASMKLGFELWFAVSVAGCFGLSAPGTLYSAMAVRTENRDVLLPVLLFPIVVPALLGAVKCAGFILNGDPMSQFGGWFQLLVGFAAAYWAVCSVLFGRVLED